MKKSKLVIITALVTLGSGIVNILSVTNPVLPEKRQILEDIFPIVFLHLSRFMSLLIGFSLIISSYNIYKRKIRAFHIVFILSFLSVLFHLTKGLNYPEAVFSTLLIFMLYISRKYFSTKSSIPDFKEGFIRLSAGIIIVFLYGCIGFWLLDKREFGINFNWLDSIKKTMLFLTLTGDPGLHPQTHHAKWFLDSLYFITATAVFYSLINIFRPAIYKFRTYPLERETAESIVKEHGKSNQDFFKYWPDKSFLFSETRNSFLCYKVGKNHALTFGDPVGPENEIQPLIGSFIEMCRENDWGYGFHQVLPDYLDIYNNFGLKKLKIGDDAIVTLTEEYVAGTLEKKFGNMTRRLEKNGIRTEIFEPPISGEIIARIKEVSDEWLTIQGRRERGFTLGIFDYDYVKNTPVVAVIDSDDKYHAFLNIIPSFSKGETTIDLMRRRVDVPNGVMDYLFMKTIRYGMKNGFSTFNMGMAPMSGFQEREEAGIEERAIHAFFQNLNFLFSYRGLRSYKAKFANKWEPRYLIYRNFIDLPGLASALNNISTIKMK